MTQADTTSSRQPFFFHAEDGEVIDCSEHKNSFECNPCGAPEYNWIDRCCSVCRTPQEHVRLYIDDTLPGGGFVCNWRKFSKSHEIESCIDELYDLGVIKYGQPVDILFTFAVPPAFKNEPRIENDVRTWRNHSIKPKDPGYKTFRKFAILVREFGEEVVGNYPIVSKCWSVELRSFREDHCGHYDYKMSGSRQLAMPLQIEGHGSYSVRSNSVTVTITEDDAWFCAGRRQYEYAHSTNVPTMAFDDGERKPWRLIAFATWVDSDYWHMCEMKELLTGSSFLTNQETEILEAKYPPTEEGGASEEARKVALRPTRVLGGKIKQSKYRRKQKTNHNLSRGGVLARRLKRLERERAAEEKAKKLEKETGVANESDVEMEKE